MADRLLRKLVVHYIAPRFPLRPTTLFVSPTLKCSARCSHCSIWAEGGRGKIELDADRWKSILANEFFSAIHTLWFSGGEPTLRADLPTLALHAIELLPALESITIASNGLDPNAVAKFLDAVLPVAERRRIYIHLHLSLDGPDKIHDRVRGVEGAFASLEKTAAIAKAIRDHGRMVGYGFNCVIQKENADALDETAAVAARLGGGITFNVADVSTGYYRTRPGSRIGDASRAKAASFVTKLVESADRYHRRHYETVLSVLGGGARPHRCETMEATMYLDPDSSVYPCPGAYDAVDVKLTDVSPDKAWKILFDAREKIRRDKCAACSLGCSFGEGVTIGEAIELALGRRGR